MSSRYAIYKDSKGKGIPFYDEQGLREFVSGLSHNSSWKEAVSKYTVEELLDVLEHNGFTREDVEE